MLCRYFLLLILFCLGSNLYCQKVEFKSKDGYYSIVLEGDSVFYYTYRAGFQYNVSNGYYKKINTNLILNSKLDGSLLIPLVVKEFKDNVNDKLTFEIINEMPLDSNRKYVILLDGKEAGCKIEKKIEIGNVTKFSTIQVMLLCKERSYIPIELRDTLISNIYNIRDLKSNSFKIYWDINTELFNYIPIKNDTLLLKKNKIIWSKEGVVLLKVHR